MKKLGTVKIFVSPEFMHQKLEKMTAILLISLIFLDILIVTVLYIGIGKNVIYPVIRLAESVRIIASGCAVIPPAVSHKQDNLSESWKNERIKTYDNSCIGRGRDGLFTFSGLHEDILVWRTETGEVHEIETDGMWVGLEPDISHLLSDNFLRLEPGDSMVLFTDGITEAQDGNGKLFGQKRLINIIEEFGNKPAYMMHKNIINALEHWEKPDDVTLVVKRFGNLKLETGLS
ncbi:MAG: SpoIIE family protein phosphatase [Desulfobacteraceae bacterium]|nr:SpoIIE family protein phosphatase [Desulfobacteraceae bacterium]